VAAPLVLQAGLAATGTTMPWSRFAVLVVPVGILALVGVIGALGPGERPGRAWLHGLLALAIIGPAVPGSVLTMASPRLALDSTKVVAAIRAGQRGGDGVDDFDVQRDVARRLDAMHLPTGSVLLDVSNGFGIVLASRRPSQFVITPDRDFQRALADPTTFGVRYLLTPKPGDLPQYDAVAAAYPNLYATGGGIATKVAEFDGTGYRRSWRLLRTNPSTEFKAGP
jgi:hypothetical protein